ncbi:MAG: ribbon-helix-helix protein, CopG family [Verrucomicrobiota bacterium JB024]|nr:ribbon-helix-helix protein, CopG family [Verrucomicrobiota bacterium JB024]
MKRTMTLNLSPSEMESLEELCRIKDLSKTGVIRQALRLYQTASSRVSMGGKLLIEDEEKKEKTELLLV